MSTSSVCQGLQSCLEPGLAEPRALRLKPSLKDSPFNPHPEAAGAHQVAQCPMMDGLSFLQALASPSADAGSAKVYVHPMVKRSASTLSAKSLAMCTESLGSETGSGGEISMLAMERESEKGVSHGPSPRRLRPAPAARRMSRSASFPPPLASGGLKVRPHREDGRLVLRAVAVAPSSSCFHAERADGRLRLRLRDFAPNRDVEDEDEEMGEEDEAENESESESDNGDYEEEEEDSDEEEDETEEVLCGGESEKNGDTGVKRGKRKLERYIRCKEDGCGNNNRGLLNCNQPYLVAT